MARFSVDADVSPDVVRGLRSYGHDGLSASDTGMRHADDEQQLIVAVLQSRLLVSHNSRDFLLLHRAWLRWPPSLQVSFPLHAGIAVIPQKSRLDHERAVAVLHDLITSSPILANSFVLWKPSRG